MCITNKAISQLKMVSLGTRKTLRLKKPRTILRLIVIIMAACYQVSQTNLNKLLICQLDRILAFIMKYFRVKAKISTLWLLALILS